MNKRTRKVMNGILSLILLFSVVMMILLGEMRDPETIHTAMTAAGSREGMITMDQFILELYRAGKITRETALEYADKPEQLKRQL